MRLLPKALACVLSRVRRAVPRPSTLFRLRLMANRSAVVAVWSILLVLLPRFVQSAPPPNILLIFADDIGYEALNCYGGQDFKTPNLNRMAETGLRFSRAYTSPVCTPSRGSMHTGLYTTRHQHYNVLPVHNGTDKKVDFQKMPTYAQLMRANGYATSVTGKWQLATLEIWPDHIRDAGFDSWCVWQIWKDGAKTLRHWNPTFNEDGKVRDDIAQRFGPDVLVDYVVEQMAEAIASEQPFLIVHNELLPHFPMIDTPDDRRLGRPAKLGNMIEYMDKLVGQLLDSVTDLGIRDNTYIVFMGDNGTQAPYFQNPRVGKQADELEHTRHTIQGKVNGGKAEHGDAGCHVPLLVWGPKSIPAGTVCDDLIDVVDLFPTFCELSSTTIPSELAIDGRSITAQLHGQAGIPRPWTHQGLYKEEYIFDGSWRLFRTSGELLDARHLPAEPLAAENDPDAIAARAALTALFKKITADGPRPPEAFPAR